jgi:protein phosphatase
VRHFSKWNLRVDDAIASEVIARAERFYRHVDSAVTQLPWTDEGRPIQTTLTATFSAGRDLFFAHVGHSRAYLLRDRSLLRLTRDHTVRRAGSRLAPVTPLGPLVDVNDTARDLKHILTNTIGMRGRVGPTIDLEHVQLDDNDRVLVCTNGLTDSIDDDRIAEVLSSGQTPDEQCRVLVDLAMASGGDDDVTAIVGSYRIPVSE